MDFIASAFENGLAGLAISVLKFGIEKELIHLPKKIRDYLEGEYIDQCVNEALEGDTAGVLSALYEYGQKGCQEYTDIELIDYFLNEDIDLIHLWEIMTGCFSNIELIKITRLYLKENSTVNPYEKI